MPGDFTPPWLNLPLELRALAEWLTPLAWRHRMSNWPRGHGHPVIVYPGFGQNDTSTRALRNFLGSRGFVVEGWQLGRNWGLRKGMTGRLLAQAETLAESAGLAPALVGWSLGGVFARELARKRPDLFSQIVSLGSPIGGGEATTIDTLFRRLNPGPRPDPEQAAARRVPPPLPCTALYTRSDGIVAWQAACEPAGAQTENIAVRGSHMGLGSNPMVWYACAHRLSPDTRGQPFNWPPELAWLAPKS